MRLNRLQNVAFLVLIGLAIVSVGCSAQQPGPEEAAEAPVDESTAATETADAAATEPAYGAPSEPAAAPTAPPAREAGRTIQPAAPPAAPPEPELVPEPVIVTVPAGTVIDVAFLDGVSSNGSQVGDSFRTRVTRDIMQDGVPVIPAGSVVEGQVTEAVPLTKKIGGKARLALEFSQLELPSGRSALIHAAFAEAGKSETKKDAATIGGAAAGGALLGRLLKKHDKDKGTLIGAIVGAAAGTAIAAKTEGEEVEIPAGVEISIELTEPAQIAVTP